MKADDIETSLNELAEEIHKSIVKYLEATNHKVMPSLEVDYQLASTFRGPAYMPVVTVIGQLKSQV